MKIRSSLWFPMPLLLVTAACGAVVIRSQFASNVKSAELAPPVVADKSIARGSVLKSRSEPNRTTDVDEHLGIPAVVQRPNAKFARPYQAQRAGLRVRYLDNIFSTNQPELMWVPEEKDGKYILHWQTREGDGYGLLGIFPGNVLQCVDNELYDFGVGTLFVKVRHEEFDCEGYILLETFIGETEPLGNQLWRSGTVKKFETTGGNVSIDGITIYAVDVSRDPGSVDPIVKDLSEPEHYERAFGGGHEGIHPILAANAVHTALLHSLTDECTPARRKEILGSATTFFDEYVFPKSVQMPGNSVSWPYAFEWRMNWGIKLSPPWYSCYANGVLASASAIMYRLTEEERYRDLAIKAANYIGHPIEEGGGEYKTGGFRLPAEYVYNTPPLPNVRVIDGEFVALTALYNASRLLGDSRMLQTTIRQGCSLTAQLDFYTQQDGNLMFSMYGESMPEAYSGIVWSNLQVFSNALKDRTLLESAERLERFVPKKWMQSHGFE